MQDNRYERSGKEFLEKMRITTDGKQKNLNIDVYKDLTSGRDEKILTQAIGECLELNPELSNIDWKKYETWFDITAKKDKNIQEYKNLKMAEAFIKFVSSRYDQLYAHQCKGKPMSLVGLDRDEVQASCDIIYNVDSYKLDTHEFCQADIDEYRKMSNVSNLIDVIARNKDVIDYVNERKAHNLATRFRIYRICDKVKTKLNSFDIDLTGPKNKDLLEKDFLNDVVGTVLPDIIKECKKEKGETYKTNNNYILIKQELDDKLGEIYQSRQNFKNLLKNSEKYNIESYLYNKKLSMQNTIQRMKADEHKKDEMLFIARERKNTNQASQNKNQKNTIKKSSNTNQGDVHILDVLFDNEEIKEPRWCVAKCKNTQSTNKGNNKGNMGLS